MLHMNGPVSPILSHDLLLCYSTLNVFDHCYLVGRGNGQFQPPHSAFAIFIKVIDCTCTLTHGQMTFKINLPCHPDHLVYITLSLFN